MKLKIFAAAVFIALVYACGSKVAVTAQQPDPVQVPPKMAAATPDYSGPQNLASGKSLYEGKCANCHKLFNPTDFSKEDWAPILARMQKKARIDDTDMALINAYILSNLKQ